jgi:thiosulfate dehydrogenase
MFRIGTKLGLTHMRAWTLLAAGAMAFALVVVPAAMAAEDEGAIARGGKLYDKWYKVVGLEDPQDTHPAYPAAGKQKGASTWRCKECHGWDYQGVAGAYAKGSHFSGITGISGMAGADTAAIVAVLKDDTHALAGKMQDEDFQDLALFVSKGQVDMDQFIDRGAKMPKGGDKAQGAAYFNTICVACHRQDGTYPKDMEKTLGAQMGNPWEVMHKILNGQPDEKMPALRALDRQVVLDIMGHLTTLPKEK